MNIFKKYRDFFVYMIYGAMATIINAGIYALLFQVVQISNVSSTIIAWIITLIFAFFTNKFFVYRSDEKRIKFVIKEFYQFFLCRALSGIFDVLFMYITVDILSLHPILMKLIAALFVGLINYYGGKLIIFKDRK